MRKRPNRRTHPLQVDYAHFRETAGAGPHARRDDMNSGEAPVDTPDGLTRSTLRMATMPSAEALATLLAALKRVPGVLLAEVAPGADRAVVAHDAAVPSAILVEAAARSGVRLTLVDGTRSRVAQSGPAPLMAGSAIRRFAVFAAAVIFGPLLLAAIGPHLATNRLFVPVILASVWAFFIARALFGRRPKHP